MDLHSEIKQALVDAIHEQNGFDKTGSVQFKKLLQLAMKKMKGKAKKLKKQMPTQRSMRKQWKALKSRLQR